ncbi:MAG: hypothetical protein WCL10_03630 [Novosphingobium sp.]|jgi:sugar lactone lactonase YvrE|uniref:SMP-30/gluconolactonase/LRE family protein n=1 Tax=Novosphingobium sp. TaxID=1874826 RepID=UPI003019F20B
MNHDGGITEVLPVTCLATWPRGSFVESVAVSASGAIFVSLHTDQMVVRIDPATGAVSPFASFPAPTTGLAFAADGTLVVTGGAPGTPPGLVWRVSPEGAVQQVAEIADAAFLNGLTPLGSRMLIADSLGSRILALDPATGAVETWLADPLLGADPASGAPGANGIKVFGNMALISVTGADRLVGVPIDQGRPGTPEVLAEALRADDFAIDAGGSLYIATHQAQSLLRLAPDGTRTTLAGAGEGMVGSTAVAFGRTEADRTAIYVTTTGGTWTVPEDQLEEAKLLRIDVGQPGAPLLGED